MDTDFDPALSRAIAYEQLQANMRREREAAQARPFRFEDLNGKPEPERWGPCYPKTASAAVEKWRATARGRELTADESRGYGQAVHAWIRTLNAPKRAANTLPEKSNCASGQALEFDAVKYRASMHAKFHAQAAADRLAWAQGKSKGFAKGERGLTITQVYTRAIAEKRARHASELVEAA